MDYKYDLEFYNIVKDIMQNENFKKLDSIEHHGTTRMNHSIRVAYYSYQIGKKLHLKSKSIARAALLHDFFMSYKDRTSMQRFLSTFTHPKYAAINAKKEFELDDLEYNIIRTHMFPINLAIPKYFESWVVSTVDKIVGFYEFGYTNMVTLKYAKNYLYFFFLLRLFTRI